MTTIPQVARALREILTTTAAEAGRATRFVQRTSPLNGATFSQTLVFGFLGNPQATLEELTKQPPLWASRSAHKRWINALRHRPRPACTRCS
jgi:hypothetical protein